MSSVNQGWLTGDIQNVVNHSGQIVHSDFVPGEMPELAGFQFQGLVPQSKGIPTSVAIPNVVALIGEHEGQGIVGPKQHIASGIVE